MISYRSRLIYLLLTVIFMLSLASSVFAETSSRYNVQFRQIDKNIAFKGKRTEIIVTSTNRRNYNQVTTDKIYGWFDVIGEEDLIVSTWCPASFGLLMPHLGMTGF